MIAEEFISAVIPLFLPLRVVSWWVQGIIRPKRIAALGGLGSIGKSTLLISPRHGTRLALSGVVTEMEAGVLKIPLAADFCGNCRRCVRSCPGGAIGPDGVNVFRCRNISPWVPAPFVPAVIWLMSMITSRPCSTGYLRIAR
jgi:epoxyqueuosine reductase QueG